MAGNNESSIPTVALESPQWIFILSGIFMSYLLILGVSFNGVVLAAFIRNKRHFNKNNAVPFAILLNGFCMASVTFILPTVAEFAGGFLNAFSMDACVVEAFAVYMFGLASMLLNVAVAIYRYIAVSRLTLNISNKSIIKMVLSCQAVALFLALCPLLGWGSYGLEAHGTSCGLEWNDRSPSNWSYIITIGVFCYLLPLTIIVYSYANILKTVSTCTCKYFMATLVCCIIKFTYTCSCRDSLCFVLFVFWIYRFLK